MDYNRRTPESLGDAATARGPDRVVVSPSGYSVPLRQAKEEYNVTPDVIFVREDGWSLGAPKKYEKVAFAAYMDEWIGFIRMGEPEFRPITHYPGAGPALEDEVERIARLIAKELHDKTWWETASTSIEREKVLNAARAVVKGGDGR